MIIRAAAIALAAGLALAGPAAVAQDEAPVVSTGRAPVEQTTFRTLDNSTPPLTGYLFRPQGVSGKAPAIVLMHSRDGVYSSRADGDYKASTLTPRMKWWGQYWAGRGYYVLVVDSYGARGFPQGVADVPVKERPASIDDVDVRPLDAFGALQYLRKVPGVDGDRIGLMGFSNGGTATLAAMADDKPGDMRKIGFRAGVALYPFCSLKKRFDKSGYKPYAPVRVFMGADDKGSSPEACQALVDRSAKKNGDIALTLYAGAAHGFDEPGKTNQAKPASATATEDVRAKAAAFFEQALAPR
jgi:dienelactone hydrolase